MQAMLEHIRRNHRLHTLVLGVFAALWLVALLAGAQVRALPMLASAHAAPAAMAHDLCMALGEGMDLPQAADVVGAPPAAAPEHGSHHDPDCLLCLALSPPPVLAVVVYRPPVPQPGFDWLAPAHFPPSQQAAAPLPARGPPAPFHA